MSWPQYVMAGLLAVNFISSFWEKNPAMASAKMLGAAVVALILNEGGFWS